MILRTELDNYLKEVPPPLFALGWHISELTASISYRTVLNVDDSLLLVPASVWKKQSVELVINYSSDHSDSRQPIHPSDIAFILLTLPFYSDIPELTRNVGSHNPEYIVTAEQSYSENQLTSLVSGSEKNASWITCILPDINRPAPRKTLEQSGYYPIEIYTSRIQYPAHTFETTLYSKDLTDRSVYDEADYIIQVNSSCNFQCDGCYVDKLGETMHLSVYRRLLESIESGSAISIRGGEPTLVPNLIEDYIEPALNKGIRTVLESNGSFVDKQSYPRYRKLFQHPLLTLRISLDKRHESSLRGTMKESYIRSIRALFHDAISNGFRLGFYALGMTNRQIREYLNDNNLDELLPYVRPITRYHDITHLPLKGRFIDLYGNIHDTIKGVIHRND